MVYPEQRRQTTMRKLSWAEELRQRLALRWGDIFDITTGLLMLVVVTAFLVWLI